MNYILVEQDERLQVLVSIVRRLRKSCTVILFSETQFLRELFALMGIEANLSTSSGSSGLQIYYDPQSDLQTGLVFVFPEQNIKYEAETKLEKNKQAQFVNDDVQKLVSRNYNLNCLAEKAYKDFVHTYQHKLDQSVYDVLKLNPMRLCRSFGFEVTPRLNNFRLKPKTEYSQKVKESKLGKTRKVKKTIKKPKKSIKR